MTGTGDVTIAPEAHIKITGLKTTAKIVARDGTPARSGQAAADVVKAKYRDTSHLDVMVAQLEPEKTETVHPVSTVLLANTKTKEPRTSAKIALKVSSRTPSGLQAVNNARKDPTTTLTELLDVKPVPQTSSVEPGHARPPSALLEPTHLKERHPKQDASSGLASLELVVSARRAGTKRTGQEMISALHATQHMNLTELSANSK